MSLIALARQIPDGLRALALRFKRLYLEGDPDHSDDLIELAVRLECTPEGAAFVQAFCNTGLEL
jgi:hypothetical protein